MTILPTLTEDQIIARSTSGRERVVCPSCEGTGRLPHGVNSVVCGRCVSYGTVWAAA